jgi:aquaporin Z
MAQDLAATPRTGLDAQLSGDAHPSNFGGFASPERDLVFDFNDFDETLRGPFEWDVKRLAASFEILARTREFSRADRVESVLQAVRGYREAMRRFAGVGDLEVWYARLIRVHRPAVAQQRAAAVVKARRRRWNLLALEFPALHDFDDPGLEWRRLFAELFGTFLLVLAGAGAVVVGALSHGAIGRSAAVAAPGLMVLAIILFMVAVSGAHLNPAVTLAFSLRGDFPWRRLPGYVLVQLAGATLACLFLWALYGKHGALGATEPGAGIADWQALLTELVLTLGLVSTILGTASRAQNVGALSAVAVGGYIILAGLWSSPVSGASMNPARSFGPDLALGRFDHLWLYWVGPAVGAVIAVGMAWLLRGPGGDPGGVAAARGRLPTSDRRQTPRLAAGGSRSPPTGSTNTQTRVRIAVPKLAWPPYNLRDVAAARV